MGFHYSTIEAALAQAVDSPPVEIPTIRTRLRLLRKIGIPNVKATGSGNRVEYTRSDALEMIVALELQAMGANPKTITTAVEQIVRRSHHYREADQTPHRHGDLYIVVRPSFSAHPEMGQMYGEANLSRFMKMHFQGRVSRHVKAASVVNVTACARYVFHALNELEET